MGKTYIYILPPSLDSCTCRSGREWKKIWTKSKIFGHLSPNFLVTYDKKGPKSFGGEIAYGKVPKKFQNSWGGVRPGLENTQIKAAFSFVGCPLFVNSQFVATIMLYEVVFSRRSDIFLIFWSAVYPVGLLESRSPVRSWAAVLSSVVSKDCRSLPPALADWCGGNTWNIYSIVSYCW